jgi:hypothetical protein
MKVSSILGSMALVSAISFSQQALAITNVTDLGNIVNTTTAPQSLLQVGTSFLPEVYSFDLSSDSTVTVDFDLLFGTISAGSTFALYSPSNTLITSYVIPALSAGGSTLFTFSSLAAGNDYSFKFSASSSSIFSAQVSFTGSEVSTPVPEPENNALMLVGLGIIGLIARRKFA